jgi:hypothetical protein
LNNMQKKMEDERAKKEAVRADKKELNSKYK